MVYWIKMQFTMTLLILVGIKELEPILVGSMRLVSVKKFYTRGIATLGILHGAPHGPWGYLTTYILTP